MAAAPVHPVRLVVTDDLQRSRLTVFFRLLLVIPHLLWLGLFGIGVFFVAIVNWFATLFTGRAPKGIHDFLGGYLRYRTHVYGYLLLGANPYPKFYFGAPLEPYPVDLEIDEPVRQNRWITFFRLFLAFPALAIAGILVGGTIQAFFLVLYSVTAVTAMFSWFSVLVRGRTPPGLRDVTAWSLGYRGRTMAYLWMLTDRYPNLGPVAMLRGTPVPPAPGRAQVINTDDLHRPRLTVFFRLLLAFPHLFWLELWTIAALLAAIANWVVTLVLGRPARPLARFLSAYVRYNVHVSAFLYVVGGPFPGFVGKAGSYPVDLSIAPPGRQHRAVTLFKLVLMLPAAILNGVLFYVLFIAAVFGWFASLVRGRMPSGLQEAGAFSIGYTAQLNCYVFSLTDQYPHSSPLAVLAST